MCEVHQSNEQGHAALAAAVAGVPVRAGDEQRGVGYGEDVAVEAEVRDEGAHAGPRVGQKPEQRRECRACGGGLGVAKALRHQEDIASACAGARGAKGRCPCRITYAGACLGSARGGAEVEAAVRVLRRHLLREQLTALRRAYAVTIIVDAYSLRECSMCAACVRIATTGLCTKCLGMVDASTCRELSIALVFPGLAVKF
mmetsp:Transcript_176454/g.560518  ORF Transcript_176454/g.560518 Transcript_176454/m.560518 type:complete len:200 (-) Transcript_176454:35-634(-)